MQSLKNEIIELLLGKHVQDLSAKNYKTDQEIRDEHIAQSQGIIAITSGMYGLPLWLSAQ